MNPAIILWDVKLRLRSWLLRNEFLCINFLESFPVVFRNNDTHKCCLAFQEPNNFFTVCNCLSKFSRNFDLSRNQLFPKSPCVSDMDIYTFVNFDWLRTDMRRYGLSKLEVTVLIFSEIRKIVENLRKLIFKIFHFWRIEQIIQCGIV